MEHIRIVLHNDTDETLLMQSLTAIVDGCFYRDQFPHRKTISSVCNWQLDARNDWFATLVRRGDFLTIDELPVENDTLYLFYRYGNEPLLAIKPWLEYRYTPRAREDIPLLKVYLDDTREAPGGWTRVRWPEEAIALLKTGEVEELSLDHDLGNDTHGTGNDVILWIEEAVATREFCPPIITVHSANSSARQKMGAGIQNIERLAEMQAIKYFNITRVEAKLDDKTGPEDDQSVNKLSVVYDKAISVFIFHPLAINWITSPCVALGNQTPAHLLNTDGGFEQVMDRLGQIEQGVFS